jgi:uncharacterized protein YegP (UPF0339 family)
VGLGKRPGQRRLCDLGREHDGWQVRAVHRQGGEFRFRLKASNRQTIAASEAYNSKASALNGVQSVRTNAPDTPIEDET